MKLKTIVHVFVDPLEILVNSFKPILTQAEIRTIFGNVRELVEVHEEVLDSFESVMKKWPDVRGLGEKVIAFSPRLVIYGQYVKNCPAALQMCNNLRRSNPAFASFLKEAETKLPRVLRGVELADLLPCPLNQIGVYELSLQRILDGTDPLLFAGEELTSLTKAVTVIRHLHSVVQVSFDLSHNRLQAVQIESIISGLKGFPGDENRRFIGYWNLEIFSKHNLSKKIRSRILFLFSDCAVFAKPKGGPTGSSQLPFNSQTLSVQSMKQLCKAKEVVKIDQIVVKDDKSAPVAPAKSLAHPGTFLNRQRNGQSPTSATGQSETCFSFSSPHFSCIVRCATPADKVMLKSQFETLTQQFQNDVQVFGVDLPTILFREDRLNQVPLVVEMLATYIRSSLFRFPTFFVCVFVVSSSPLFVSFSFRS